MQDIANLVAIGLGQDPAEMQRQAEEGVRAAGFCAGHKCTAEEIQEWATTHGASLPGTLGEYVRGISSIHKSVSGSGGSSGGGTSGSSSISTSSGAAHAVAVALGEDPVKMRKDAGLACMMMCCLYARFVCLMKCCQWDLWSGKANVKGHQHMTSA